MKFEELYTVENNHRSFEWELVMIYLVQRGRSIYGPAFSIPPALEKVYQRVITYAIQDKAGAAEQGLNLGKGLILLGPAGVGKTAILQLCKPFFLHRDQYNLVTTRLLAQDYSCRGYEVFGPLFNGKGRPVCLDGAGKETVARNYGTPCDVVKHVVEHFYDMRYDFARPHLHITSHLTPQEVEVRYGKEFRRMVAALFNVVVVKGP